MLVVGTRRRIHSEKDSACGCAAGVGRVDMAVAVCKVL